MPNPSVVVFDIGNVLLDWDPRHLYRKMFDDHARMEHFLAEVCTPAWNIEQDRGRLFRDAVAELVARHPHLDAEIRAFDERWLETVSGTIQGSVDLLAELQAQGVPTYAITNFSAEKFVDAQRVWPFLGSFLDVIVSGEHRVLKPDPAIYRLLLDGNGLAAEACVFIDDSPKNVAGAQAVGMHALHFTSADKLRADLKGFGFPV
ncbi:HAD family phosphatase [uncultured Alsobacter sp.]|uniref:HAD family hydrolase n=1 Tax=uncultured Alsobacter sp. TaxID=1748258 RepID=UPI0025EA5758|nr:HAD family phosphatase [uncultured Alsobacter sp.]